MLKYKSAPAILVLMVIVLFWGGCETTSELTQKPARLLFIDAESVENQGLLSEAITRYEQLIKENPGTRLATFSYLRVAELQVKLEKWKESETNYRAFLSLHPKSHLTPFILYRLLQVNHERSYTGTFFKAREVDRDMAPNRNIILEYKRFLLLYPKSPYLEEVKPFYRAAISTLAESELMVGDFYFDNEQYNAAIGRYQYLLRNYPHYPKTREVLRRLIEAYKRNNQPEMAKELIRVQSESLGKLGEINLAPQTKAANSTTEIPASSRSGSADAS